MAQRRYVLDIFQLDRITQESARNIDDPLNFFYSKAIFAYPKCEICISEVIVGVTRINSDIIILISDIIIFY